MRVNIEKLEMIMTAYFDQTYQTLAWFSRIRILLLGIQLIGKRQISIAYFNFYLLAKLNIIAQTVVSLNITVLNSQMSYKDAGSAKSMHIVCKEYVVMYYITPDSRLHSLLLYLSI
jgi:hypothetical protein